MSPEHDTNFPTPATEIERTESPAEAPQAAQSPELTETQSNDSAGGAATAAVRAQKPAAAPAPSEGIRDNSGRRFSGNHCGV